MSGSERSIIVFANLVAADNFYGAKEALERATGDDKIMMEAILIKTSEDSSVSSGMRNFINSVIDD